MKPEECTIHRSAEHYQMKEYNEKNFLGLEEFEKGGIWNGMDFCVVK